MDSSLQQRIFDVSHVDMVLFIILEDVVHENLLGATHSCHDICWDESGQFQCEVAFFFAFSLSMDGFDHVVKYPLHEGVVHSLQTFYHIIGNTVHLVFLESLDVLNECLDWLSGSEQLSYRLIDQKVSWPHSKNLVAHLHAFESVIYE